MRELENFELENLYGGAILTGATLAIATVLVAIAAYRMVTSTKAKIKLPNGTDISFENPREKTSSAPISVQTSKTTNNSSQIVLNQLDNKAQTFSSTPGNFLVKV